MCEYYYKRVGFAKSGSCSALAYLVEKMPLKMDNEPTAHFLDDTHVCLAGSHKRCELVLLIAVYEEYHSSSVALGSIQKLPSNSSFYKGLTTYV